MKSLSRRERDVLKLVADGCTAVDVAEKLSLSANTVRAHYAMIRAKLDCKTIAGAVAIAMREGLI